MQWQEFSCTAQHTCAQSIIEHKPALCMLPLRFLDAKQLSALDIRAASDMSAANPTQRKINVLPSVLAAGE